MAKYKHDRFFYHYYITLKSGFIVWSHSFKEEGYRSEEEAEQAMHLELIRMLQDGVKVDNSYNSIGIKAYLRDRRIPTVPAYKGWTYYRLMHPGYTIAHPKKLETI